MLPSPDTHNKIFLHITKGEFKNKHGVLFEAEDHNFLHATKQIGFIPELAELTIELLTKAREFVRALNVTSPGDLYKIDQCYLETLYSKGLAVIVCQLNLTYTHYLIFKRIEGNIFAENSDRSRHLVKDNLKSPRDYFTYTVSHYKAMANNLQ